MSDVELHVFENEYYPYYTLWGSALKGTTTTVTVPEDTYARWRRVLGELDAVQAEIAAVLRKEMDDDHRE